MPHDLAGLSEEGRSEVARHTVKGALTALTLRELTPSAKSAMGTPEPVNRDGSAPASSGTAGPRPDRVEVQDSLESILDLYESRRWTDGLPIVPPTPERVKVMVAAAGRAPDDVIAVLPPGHGSATIEKIAVNAVMAGCRPEYMPVIVAAVEALADPVFNLQGIQGTTNPVAPLLIVNGPIRDGLGFNHGYGCFGPGWRANATVGRAVRLVLINIGGGVPGETDMAVAGHPGKYTFCVSENEGESPWEPLHVERGFPKEDSVVTVVGISSFINSLGGTVEELAEAATFTGNNDYRFGGCPVFSLNPMHARVLADAGCTKLDVKRRLFELSQKRVGDFARSHLDPRTDLEPLGDPDKPVPMARRPEDLIVIVAGASGAGGHSLVLPSFGNTQAVSRAVHEVSG